MSEVSIFITVVVMVSVVFMFYMYDKKDNTQYQQTLAAIDLCNKNYSKLEELINKNIQSVGLNNQEVAKLETKVNEMKADCSLNGYDIDALRVRCEKLKESQIELQDKLSNKRPVIIMKQPPMPTPVDFLSGEGMDALLKPKGKKSKEAVK